MKSATRGQILDMAVHVSFHLGKASIDTIKIDTERLCITGK